MEDLSKDLLENVLETSWAGKEILYFDTIDSTNEEAKRQAQAGAGHGTLVLAELQQAGKGRRGRSFDSPQGAGIWMSLVIKDDIEPSKASILTLVMGLAAAKAVECVTSLKPQIKWPNDLILNGKKLCGILTEMSLEGDRIGHIVIGVGINVHNEEFPEEIAEVATSVYQETGERICRANLLAEVLKQFEYFYKIYKQTFDMSDLMQEYNACLINRGRQVQVLDPKGSYLGQALGINDQGDLLVETENEVRQVFSGEASVRGVLGYV